MNFDLRLKIETEETNNQQHGIYFGVVCIFKITAKVLKHSNNQQYDMY